MAQQGFFDANQSRAYPFQEGTTAQPITGPLTLIHLPDAVIVDCGFLLGPQTGFDPRIHSVFLQRIRRAGSMFFFDFAADCPGLLGVELTFARTLSSAHFTTEWADSGEVWGSETLVGSESASQFQNDLGTHCNEPLWSGFLATGDLAPLDLFLAGDGAVGRGTSGGTTVEPAMLQSLVGSAVTALAVVNADRTRTTGDGSCPDPTWPYPTGQTYINAICLTGPIHFTAGYNAIVRQNSSDNSLIFGAAVGAGAGEVCGAIALFPGETPPEGSTLLEGGKRCNEVLRTINGVGGPLLQFNPGSGVALSADPDNHQLTIDVNMAGMAVCPSSEPLIVSETLP